MSKIEVDQVDPQSGTNLTLGTSGDSIIIPSGVTLANSGTMTGVPVPTTGIAASAISSGTIATARLGSGTASSSTFLRGDQTYAAAGGGKVLQVVQGTSSISFSQTSPTNGTIYYPSSNKLTASITPSLTSSKILVQFVTSLRMDSTSGDMGMGTAMQQIISGGSTTTIQAGGASSKPYSSGFYFSGTIAPDTRVRINEIVLLSPSTTSAITYEVGIAGYNVTLIRMNDDDTTGRIILTEVAV